MLQLRAYQQDLLRQVQTALDTDTKSRVMMQLPTGGGKTVIAGALLADWLSGGSKAVWLTHRRELAEQTRGMLTDAGISAIADVVWTPNNDAPAMSGGVVILMAQTVSRRTARMEVWDRYDSDDLMVIDEAHHAAAAGWERAMRQWPGHIVGMTASPWRLSEEEGFDHLFGSLICGPQVADLETLGSLCQAQVLIPPPEQRIVGGAVDRNGDYSESGIEQANRDRPDVLTARALGFWQKHAGDRPTIAYAVSVGHALSLESVFNEAGIRVAVILGDSNREGRNRAIAGFRSGTIKVLVNVVVATEGFDLPHASCIIIGRPTLSLALYLQMVGRGLRPKDGGGNCLILDLTANSVTHGLPAENREWSLKPRGTQSQGDSPIVVCQCCETASPASSHRCPGCGYAFGKDCDRCGKWRAWNRWTWEKHCGNAHELVCDLCHIDAHIQAHLLVTPPLDELVNLYDPEDEMMFPEDTAIDDDLANRMSVLLRELLELERRSVEGADEERCTELRRLIELRDAELNDDNELERLFGTHIRALPETERPVSRVQGSRMFVDWERNIQSELARWKEELVRLEGRVIDKQLIFDGARNKLMRLFQREAQAAGLLPDRFGNGSETDVGTDDCWCPLLDLGNTVSVINRKPYAVRFPNDTDKSVRNWKGLYIEVAEWLIDKGHLSQDRIPNKIAKLVCFDSFGRRRLHKLKNGSFTFVGLGSNGLTRNCLRIIEACGEDASAFYVRLH